MVMRHVIVVNGPPRAGKDTAIDFMQDYLNDRLIRTESFSSIDPIKDMLEDFVDLSAKTESDRKLLATVGDAMQEHSMYRTDYSLRVIRIFFRVGRGVFFLHMREPTLIDVVRKACEAEDITFTTILLRSSREQLVMSNPADAGVLNGQYDIIMRNDGSLDLLRTVCVAWMKSLLSNQPTVD